MTAPTALLTFSIGPVHAFIAQARRVADLWAGSDLLSNLISQAVRKVFDFSGAEMIFPAVAGEEIPSGLPNRFVCRVPQADVRRLAKLLEDAVRVEWNGKVSAAVEYLRTQGIEPAPEIWTAEGTPGSRQTDHLLDIAWSWVPEDDGYAAAAAEGAKRFAASRVFRPFPQIHETGEKCAVCGERTALPDGIRDHVRAKWEAASKTSEGTTEERYLRWDQGRLCLVCATKRLHPSQHGRSACFSAFDQFEPSEKKPYFAVVAMDGDRMGDVLSWPRERLASRNVEAFHRDLSQALTGFAESLRTPGKTELNLTTLGRAPQAGHKSPQLIYAGGEDVLFVCHPRDALGFAWKVRELYRETLQPVAKRHVRRQDQDCFTISAGVLFAHTKHPAGLLFRDAQRLLDETAKKAAGRNAVAIRLAKRSGVPVEAAFPWDQPVGEGDGRPTWVESFDILLNMLTTGAVSSRQTFNLRRDDRVLIGLLAEAEWEVFLHDRLSRREVPEADLGELARRLAPFFVCAKTDALRILRFLVREVSA